MTTERRLEAIEDSLTPTQCVLRWLSEAHAYGSLEAHARFLLDQALEDLPASRLLRDAEHTARRTAGSRVREEINRAIHRARRETLFRFELVLRINVRAHEVLDKEELVRAAAMALLAMLAGEIEVGGRGALHRQILEPTIELLLGRVAELEAAGQARALAEQRYLDEYPALFPDVRDAWEQQLRAAQEVAAMAVGLGELDGVDLPPPEDEDAISDRARVLLDDLVEPAKVTALQKLGEGESAARIATRWLRPKLDRSMTQTESDPASDTPTL